MKISAITVLFLPLFSCAQLKWTNVDHEFGPLPKGVHIYFTEQKIDTAPFRAYYIIARLKNKKLEFTTDTTWQRRMTPQQFYERNDNPLVVVNGTFFSFETNQNLNVVIKDGKLLSHNISSVKIKKGDTSEQVPVRRGAIGISKKRRADVAWLLTDSTSEVLASQFPILKGNMFTRTTINGQPVNHRIIESYTPWNMQTAIGGGPVLIQNGEIRITNEFEKMFTGKAFHDRHPRTAMGYTSNGRLIILVIEGRNPQAAGATLMQEAQILKDLGCVEALNLDGGGSSCMLVNGKETIRPSDKTQRPVPAVFIIRNKK